MSKNTTNELLKSMYNLDWISGWTEIRFTTFCWLDSSSGMLENRIYRFKFNIFIIDLLFEGCVQKYNIINKLHIMGPQCIDIANYGSCNGILN